MDSGAGTLFDNSVNNSKYNNNFTIKGEFMGQD
jgi:hypothetical protein